jgi:hypothetical protein
VHAVETLNEACKAMGYRLLMRREPGADGMASTPKRRPGKGAGGKKKQKRGRATA